MVRTDVFRVEAGVSGDGTEVLGGKAALLGGKVRVSGGEAPVLGGKLALLRGETPVLRGKARVLRGKAPVLGEKAPILRGETALLGEKAHVLGEKARVFPLKLRPRPTSDRVIRSKTRIQGDWAGYWTLAGHWSVVIGQLVFAAGCWFLVVCSPAASPTSTFDVRGSMFALNMPGRI